MDPALREVTGAVEAVVDPAVKDCLSLVKAGQFAQAVPVCTRAVKADPENQDVASALQTAQQKAAEAQATQAAEAAREAGQVQLEQAQEGLMERMPE
jgi:hypothetical protein